MENNLKTIFCLHDAGSAEYVMCYLGLNKKFKNYHFYLTGPAKKILSSKFINLKTINKISELDKYEKIICSTGWSNFNYKVMKYSIKKKIYLISIVDEETYLIKRFYYRGNILIPNEIWSKSKLKIQKFFNQRKQNKIKYYLNDYRKKYFKKFQYIRKKNYLLVATSPKIKFLKNTNIYFKKKNFSQQKILFDIKKILKKKKIIKIIFRLHPLDTRKNLSYVFNNIPIEYKFSKNILIEQDLKICKYILTYSNSVKETALHVGNKIL